MRHVSCAKRLSQYVDDTLDPGVRRAMDEHLALCSECRDDLVSLRETVHLLGSLSLDSEPPLDLASQVIARVGRGEADASTLDRWLNGWRQLLDSSWGPPLVTAGLGVALLVAVQGVEIQVTLPGFGGSNVAVAETATMPELSRVASEPVLVPIQPARGPLASRRRAEPLPVMPPLSACVGRPSDPACARWNVWMVGLGMREPKDFLARGRIGAGWFSGSMARRALALRRGLRVGLRPGEPIARERRSAGPRRRSPFRANGGAWAVQCPVRSLALLVWTGRPGDRRRSPVALAAAKPWRVS